MKTFDTIDALTTQLSDAGYVADDALATTLYLALRMGRPLFLEGAPGVGKTELARVMAHVLDTELIRLQCYEGLDVAQAAYEWNYTRQLLALQARGGQEGDAVAQVYTPEYLMQRPLLSAIEPSRTQAPVLLIDELDRADEEFESFLLELLSDFQMSIPELGTIVAQHRPVVFVTSNRTREVHDALKRRCLYHWIDYPSFDKELDIVTRKVPGVEPELSRQVVAFVQRLRSLELLKVPGVAESIDWATGLTHLGAGRLELESVRATLGLLLKVQDDLQEVQGVRLEELLHQAREVRA